MILAGALVLSVLGRRIALHLDYRSIGKTLLAGGVMAVVLVAVQICLLQ